MIMILSSRLDTNPNLEFQTHHALHYIEAPHEHLLLNNFINDRHFFLEAHQTAKKNCRILIYGYDKLPSLFRRR
jgi:hypothetical protein